MDAERQRIINNAARALRDIDQLFIDCEYWNELHPKERPLNVDPDGIMLKIKRMYEGLLANEARLGNYPNNNLTPAGRRNQIPIQLTAEGAREMLNEGGLTGHGRN